MNHFYRLSILVKINTIYAEIKLKGKISQITTMKKIKIPFARPVINIINQLI